MQATQNELERLIRMHEDIEATKAKSIEVKAQSDQILMREMEELRTQNSKFDATFSAKTHEMEYL